MFAYSITRFPVLVRQDGASRQRREVYLDAATMRLLMHPTVMIATYAGRLDDSRRIRDHFRRVPIATPLAWDPTSKAAGGSSNFRILPSARIAATRQRSCDAGSTHSTFAPSDVSSCRRYRSSYSSCPPVNA